MLCVLLCRQRRAANEPSCNHENRLARKIHIKIWMSERIRAQHVDLAAQSAPVSQIDVACLGLEKELSLFAFVAAFGDKILPELKRSVQKVDVRKTLQAQECHEWRIELTFGQRINIVGDGVG